MPGGEKFEKKPMFPDVHDPKDFGHEGDADIEQKRRDAVAGDTYADLYGHPDHEIDKDARQEGEKDPAEEEKAELKDRRP
jgi:hypothetical protein